jgi:hypothetical protein
LASVVEGYCSSAKLESVAKICVLPAAAIAIKKRPLVPIQPAYSTGALGKAADAQWDLLKRKPPPKPKSQPSPQEPLPEISDGEWAKQREKALVSVPEISANVS